MKTKYVIGFFSCLLLAAVLLTAGYQLSYRHVMDRQEARAEEEASTTESIAAEGEAVQEDGFYLSELHGYVVVYLSDKTTIYELTAALPQVSYKALDESGGIVYNAV